MYVEGFMKKAQPYDSVFGCMFLFTGILKALGANENMAYFTWFMLCGVVVIWAFAHD